MYDVLFLLLWIVGMLGVAVVAWVLMLLALAGAYVTADWVRNKYE